ncbi:Hypothetical protein AA314_04106 [Archangium gephyra]|uniref:Uncharacterized protein n=1 Tax=Archangium gephyra TaxID=48 RepID=A0AAC8Q7Q4_9BACT|nr:Hypothetical protein AA314_04106 [Archangium gephyra]
MPAALQAGRHPGPRAGCRFFRGGCGFHVIGVTAQPLLATAHPGSPGSLTAGP